MGQSIQFVSLHNNTAIVLEGNVVDLDKCDTLVIQISGTSTSFTMQFKASLDGINYFGIEGSKLSSSSSLSSTTSTNNEAWEFDASAIKYFKASITAIANGNISVLANAI